MILFRMTRKAESWKKALCCCFTVQGLMQEIKNKKLHSQLTKQRSKQLSHVQALFLAFLDMQN
jgi:hypothetical protein